MNNINEIISKCNRGDEAACKALYEAYLPYCFGICKRYGVLDSDLKDQVQICFTATFRSLASFDSSKASFKTWFTKIIIYKILEQTKKRKRIPSFDEITDYGAHFSIDDTDNLNDNLDRKYLLNILSNMPDQYQTVFNLYIMDGYTHNEISSLLDISVGSSRIILSRAREWAKKALDHYLKHSEYVTR